MTANDAVREVQKRLCCFQHCTYPNDCHWYGHGKIDRAIEAVRRDEREALAERLVKRAAEITWEPPESERRNYWPMNAVKYELGREATAIRARISKEGE